MALYGCFLLGILPECELLGTPAFIGTSTVFRGLLLLSGEGLPLLPQDAQGLRKFRGPLAQLTGRRQSHHSALPGKRQRILLWQMEMDILMDGLKQGLLEGGNRLWCGGMGRCLRFCGGRWNGFLLPGFLALEQPLHNALGGPKLLGAHRLPLQRLQHQLQVHLQHGGLLNGSGLRRLLLQELQWHIGPGPLFPFGPGQQFFRELLRQSPEGRERQTLLREYPHIGF